MSDIIKYNPILTEHARKRPARRSRRKKKPVHSHPAKTVKPNESQKILYPKEEFELFNFFADHIGDEVMFIDSHARIRYVNQATIDGLGYSRKQLLASKVTDFFKEKTSVKKWHDVRFRQLEKSKKPLKINVERVIKGGSSQTIAVTAAYIKYKDEGYILSVGRDITDQLTMQSKLKESEDLYRLLSDGAGDGIFAVDLHGNITYANRALEKLVNIPIKRAQGKNFIVHIDRNSQAKAIKCFQKAKKGVSQIREEINILDKDKRVIPVEINVSPLYKEGKIISIHAIVRDIRKRKQLELLLMDSYKMKAMQFLASGTAQEIQHPLQAIVQRVDKILTKYQKRDFEYIGFKEFSDIMHTLEVIHHQVQYCCATTNRLVGLNLKTMRTAGGFSDANSVVRECEHRMRQQFDLSDVKIKLRLTKRSRTVAIGAIELNQVITNVMNNALQAMLAGGLFIIKTYYHKTEEKFCIELKDSGIGISKENLPYIFDPFFTTKQRGVEKSSGLGLSIAYSVVTGAQGDIRVQSSLRKGTTVQILLPLKEKSRTPHHRRK